MSDAPDHPNDTPKNTVLRLYVDSGQQPMRIDQYLTQQIGNATRSKVQESMRAGHVLVNGKPAKPSYLIQPNDFFEITLQKPPPAEAKPEDIPLKIIYEDEHLLLIDKPAGMVVHPAFGNWSGTLVNAVLHHTTSLSEWKNADQTIRPGIVHRLDKDTSGVLVVAKNELVHARLSAMFSRHTIEREYLALVWGHLPEKGTIRGAIGRSKKDRKIMTVVDDESGKKAVTHFRLLETADWFSLAAITLETGRTHQIRVHLAHIGHPVLADRTYGGDQMRYGQATGKRRHFYEKLLLTMPRQCLHAHKLGFVHPVENRLISFESPLPADFALVWSMIKEFEE